MSAEVNMLRLQEEFYKAAYTNDLANLLLSVSKGVDVNETDEFGSTALHFAAQHGNTEAVAMLLDNGAIIGHKNKIGSTPLHRAAREGHESVVRLLLEKGADVNAAANDGTTPLHLAAEWGQVAVVKLLLAHGASTSAKNGDQRTPFEVASSAEVRACFGAKQPAAAASKPAASSSTPAASLPPPPASVPPPPPPSGAGLHEKLVPVYDTLDRLLRETGEKEIAAATRNAVEEIKKLGAAYKSSKPTEALDLEKAASEMVVGVKQLLTTKAAGGAAFQTSLSNLTAVVQKVKSYAAKLVV